MMFPIRLEQVLVDHGLEPPLRVEALAGREVMLVETSDQIGSGISSRNSEVIHAGIYYRPGSLKARLCVAGKHALYDYCRNNAVPHQRCGKLIVATDDEEASLLSGIALIQDRDWYFEGAMMLVYAQQENGDWPSELNGDDIVERNAMAILFLKQSTSPVLTGK